MRDDTLLKAEGRVKLQLKGNVMHQRGIFNSILVFSIVALLSCAMPYKATGAGSAQGAASRRRP
ncbi:hypothetical protein, partial [Escherichia coli]|nr:hypothetical protein [Escherichia coli]